MGLTNIFLLLIFLAVILLGYLLYSLLLETRDTLMAIGQVLTRIGDSDFSSANNSFSKISDIAADVKEIEKHLLEIEFYTRKNNEKS